MITLKSQLATFFLNSPFIHAQALSKKYWLEGNSDYIDIYLNFNITHKL